MQREGTEYHRQRALELRAIAYFIDDRRKQDTLMWLAHDYETMTDHQGTAGFALLVRRLHLVRMAEQLRPSDGLTRQSE